MVDLIKFCSEVKYETSKVSFAPKGEVLKSFVFVILVVVCSSLFFGFVDFVFLRSIKVLLGVFYGV